MVVAEELHFGRAAERLGISQPPLSQSIRRLETALGCQLLARTRRRVELTAPGEALLAHASDIINQIDYTRNAVQRAGQAVVTSVRIGFASNSLSDHVPAAIRSICAQAPLAKISLVEARTEDQIQGLLTGELDIGFFAPSTPHIDRLEIRVLARPRILAAVPEDWPLARKPELRLADFDEIPLLWFAPSTGRGGFRDALIAAFHRAGVTPRFSQEAAFSFTRLRLAAAGLGVALVSDTTAPRGFPGVVLRPIVDMPSHITTLLAMAWRRTVPSSKARLYSAAFEAAKNAYRET